LNRSPASCNRLPTSAGELSTAHHIKSVGWMTIHCTAAQLPTGSSGSPSTSGNCVASRLVKGPAREQSSTSSVITGHRKGPGRGTAPGPRSAYGATSAKRPSGASPAAALASEGPPPSRPRTRRRHQNRPTATRHGPSDRLADRTRAKHGPRPSTPTAGPAPRNSRHPQLSLPRPASDRADEAEHDIIHLGRAVVRPPAALSLGTWVTSTMTSSRASARPGWRPPGRSRPASGWPHRR
jgi:hypothetical protein